MISKQNLFLLLLILILFIFTRFYKITEIPPSVYWDEASIGYNAYSILKTGEDEWGKHLPLYFEAFGEYKLPIYIYTTVITTALFGLNEFAVRAPAVLFSFGVVIVSFLLARRLTGDEGIGLLTAFFVTISQWFFIFSRTGFEATVGLFFFISGIYFFISALEDNKKLLILSIINFILTLYSYNSFLIITPVALLILAVIYFRQVSIYLHKSLVLAVVCTVVLLIGILPVVFSFASIQSARLADVGISGAYNQTKYQKLLIITSNYLTHFNPSFLFFRGDQIRRSQQPNFGQIHIIYLPLIILGIIYSLRKRKKEYILILSLLVIAPIPASITKESPHALRSIVAVPFIALISSIGVKTLAAKFNNKLYIFLIAIGLALLSLVIYYQNFIYHYPEETAEDWQYGYKRFFNEYKSRFAEYDNILVSDRYSQPYIFALFYLKYDPERFRSEVVYNTSIRRKTSLVKSFDKFIFTNIEYNQLPKGKNLVFTHPTDKMNEIKWKEAILNPDGSIGGYVYEYSK